MSILALDLSGKNTGFARYLKDGLIESGSKGFSPLKGQPVNALFCKWSLWISAELDKKPADWVTYELIDFPMGHAWGNIYRGMVAIMMAEAFKRGAQTRCYTVLDIKKAATGKAKAQKVDMKRTARAQFPCQNIIDDDQADALWVMYLAVNDLTEHKIKHCEELF